MGYALVVGLNIVLISMNFMFPALGISLCFNVVLSFVFLDDGPGRPPPLVHAGRSRSADLGPGGPGADAETIWGADLGLSRGQSGGWGRSWVDPGPIWG